MTDLDRYDFIVIGGGPAGGKAATQAAYYGKRVAVVEKKPAPGGIAVSDAGIPTKTLRETASYLTGFRHRDIYGVSLALDARLKLDRLKSRTSEVVEIMTEAAIANLRNMRVELVHGEGRLGEVRGATKQVVVRTAEGERTLETDVVLIATGSHPHHPDGIAFDDHCVCDSEKILRIDRLPESLIVIGGGAIGCEYASIFTALGVDVSLIESTDRVLPFMDGEISRLLADSLARYGVRFSFGARVVEVKREGDRIAVILHDGTRLHAELVLFAGGRSGNTAGLDLERAGVELDPKGRIRVGASYQTAVPGIYAAGDVIGPPALASVSMEQGRVAACHAFKIPFKEVVDPLPPFGVYSIPEVAMVGLTEEAARERKIDYEVGRGWFVRNTRARIAGTTEGLVKLVFKKSDRVLLGVHIVGDIASELIHLGQVIAGQAKPIDYFIHATFNVPTFTEAYKYAAYDGLQRIGR